MPEFDAFVCCPACRGGLDTATTQTGEATLACGACGVTYAVALGAPVLIDFSRSICDPEDYRAGGAGHDGAPPQGSAIGRFLARLTYGTSAITQRALGVFVAALKQGCARPLVLVIGGGTVGQGMDALYRERAIRVIGTDIYPSRHVAYLCDGHALPFGDGTFDGVVIQAVLEHVLSPEEVVGEIHRVLKPGGLVFAETPFMQQVHMGAHDFTRFTMNGHRWLFRGFEQVAAGASLGPGTALLWSIAYYLRALGCSRPVVAVITALFCWVRWPERWMREGPASDAASGFYFVGRKSGAVLRPAEILGYYAGGGERCGRAGAL